MLESLESSSPESQLKVKLWPCRATLKWIDLWTKRQSAILQNKAWLRELAPSLELYKNCMTFFLTEAVLHSCALNRHKSTASNERHATSSIGLFRHKSRRKGVLSLRSQDFSTVFKLDLYNDKTRNKRKNSMIKQQTKFNANKNGEGFMVSSRIAKSFSLSAAHLHWPDTMVQWLQVQRQVTQHHDLPSGLLSVFISI